MRRAPSILLLLAFFALGTGSLEYLHNLDHRHEDARLAAAAQQAGLPVHPAPLHNDTNCETHAQLHMPGLATGWVPLLVFLGLFVGFLTLLKTEPVSRRPILCLDCRGPPAC